MIKFIVEAIDFVTTEGCDWLWEEKVQQHFIVDSVEEAVRVKVYLEKGEIGYDKVLVREYTFEEQAAELLKSMLNSFTSIKNAEDLKTALHGDMAQVYSLLYGDE